MVRCQRGAGKLVRDFLQRALHVHHDVVSIILPADAAKVADVVTKQRHHKMQPVARAYPALIEMLPFKDGLADLGHRHGVLDIVVRRIGVAEVF